MPNCYNQKDNLRACYYHRNTCSLSSLDSGAGRLVPSTQFEDTHLPLLTAGPLHFWSDVNSYPRRIAHPELSVERLQQNSNQPDKGLRKWRMYTHPPTPGTKNFEFFLCCREFTVGQIFRKIRPTVNSPNYWFSDSVRIIIFFPPSTGRAFELASTHQAGRFTPGKDMVEATSVAATASETSVGTILKPTSRGGAARWVWKRGKRPEADLMPTGVNMSHFDQTPARHQEPTKEIRNRKKTRTTTPYRPLGGMQCGTRSKQISRGKKKGGSKAFPRKLATLPTRYTGAGAAAARWNAWAERWWERGSRQTKKKVEVKPSRATSPRCPRVTPEPGQPLHGGMHGQRDGLARDDFRPKRKNKGEKGSAITRGWAKWPVWDWSAREQLLEFEISQEHGGEWCGEVIGMEWGQG
ncbi:hypothetical protein B0H16DRAFT_1456115 [Mycena metata]|uniref:Uncharacterized protein n=1 Tax=Mycena metata TaxID=1033252 RepID=A0AAD7JF46_9AGAR|nr:hypothetical protein B0H16DRAFT_1456115 [Mycena metata]